MSTIRQVILTEWQSLTAAPTGPGAGLVGRWLEPEYAALAGKVGLTENRYGLCIEARQHVGALRIGDLDLRILPKLPTEDLWWILDYALGLDNVERLGPTYWPLEGSDFVDLLALRLLLEADQLARAGLATAQLETSEWLEAPRGRILLSALTGPPTRAALPCAHRVRSADILENQVIRAGLALAARRAAAVPLQVALTRAEASWAEQCSRPPLSRARLQVVTQRRTRLTRRYATAHTLVSYLVDGLGPGLGEGGVELDGLLWDMSHVFEAFVARFLREHLPGIVRTQATLRDLYRALTPDPSPRLRPDLIWSDASGVRAVADTKYRDLSILPREMLYQISVYALAFAQNGAPVPALLLYPGAPRPDIVYALRPAWGPEARIIVRAVDWVAASRALRGRGDPAALAKAWMG